MAELFKNIEDVVDMIAPLLGRLEDDNDPARKAIQDPSSPEAAMLGSLILGSKGRKAVEGVVSDPVGKAKKLKRIGMRDIPTTATELPPEIPDEIKKLAGVEPKAKASAPRGTFEKLVSDPKTRKSVSEMRGPVDERGFASKMDEFTDAQNFKKAGKEVAEEGAESLAKKGGSKALSAAKAVAKFPFKHPILTIAGLIAYNSIFGDKKEKKQQPVQTNPFDKKEEARQAGPDKRMQEFEAFRSQIQEQLKNLGEKK